MARDGDAHPDDLMTAGEAARVQWESLFEQAPDGIFVADLQGRYTEVNRAGCRMLGYEREEILGKTIVDLIPPEDVSRLWQLKKQLVDGRVDVAEWTLRRKDGSFIPVEVSAKILPDGRWQGFVRDISERRRQDELAQRAREQLRESEERFRLTFEWAPIGMALVALDGTFVRVNHALCESVDYRPEELIGRTFQEITHSEDLDVDLELAGKLLRGEIPRYRLAKRYVRKDGTSVDAMLNGSVLRNDRGQPLYFIAEIEDITARKRRDEELRRTQERLELALRGADLATWDWDVASGEAVFNPRWAEMRGYRLEELRGHVDTWTSGVHPEDWPQVKLVLEEHVEGRRTDYETEHRVRTKSGQWIWVHDRGRVVARSEQGAPLRMAGTEVDITSRKQVEEALRLAEAKSSGIVSISADAIISIDRDQRITLFNEGAEKIFGYSKAEVAGAPLDILIPEWFRAVHRKEVDEFAAGKGVSRRMGEDGAVVVFGLRKNGEEFPADAAISKLEVGGERILTVVLRDITEQKRIEREQKFLAEVGPVLATSLEYEETLSRIAELAVRDLADLCIVDIVEDGEVRRLKVLARQPGKEWVAETLMRIPLDRTRPHLMWSVLETKKPVLIAKVTADVIDSWAQSEEHSHALHGLDAKSIVAVPLLAEGKLLGVLALISSTRVYGSSDLQLAEELGYRAALSLENARLYRVATRAIRVRDDVLGIVAHDLRNPLNSIVMSTSLLGSRGAQSERRSKKPVEAIERAARRMSRLIEDLLDVTRMEAGRLSVEQGRVRTAAIVFDALEGQRPLAASASLELEAAIAPGLPDVLADRDRLLQVFENLIGNALSVTEPGGRITVGGAPRDGEMLFWVADTGPGITAEDIPHLFDRFWQARKERRGGAGLGLTIVRGIIEAHGGRVWVESTPGRGSTFYFTVPTAPRVEEWRGELELRENR